MGQPLKSTATGKGITIGGEEEQKQNENFEMTLIS